MDNNQFDNQERKGAGRPGSSPEPARKSGTFQLHIPEEALRFGDEDPNSLQSFSEPAPQEQGASPKVSAAVEKQEKLLRKKEKKEAKVREKIKGRKNRGLFRCVWFAMVILTSVALARYLSVGVDDMLAISRSSGTATVELKKGDSIQTVAKTLEKSGVINNSFFFTLYCNVTGADSGFGEGSFAIDTNMDYEAIVNFLQSNSNQAEVVTITFPEGINLLEIAEKLEENGVCTAQEVIEAANSSNYNNYNFVNDIKNADERYYKLEGYLFPDTYDFYKGEDPKVALGKMINNCQNRFSKEMRETVEKSSYTIDQILTLASIVQAEATDEKDMRMIAGILMNRLDSGSSQDIYRLQCDSTTYYPYRKQADVPEAERETFKSRYDTYTIEGLPPGPICSPGLDAIKAVLEPSPESEGVYYFCHDEDGKAYYASSWSQHQSNLAEAGLLDYFIRAI